MKFISRKAHAVLDYLVGVVLIAAPWLLGFSDNNAATWSAVGVGVVTLLMSAMTDYEGGLMKVISMSTHLTMDLIAGIFLAVSPWLLGYADRVFLPHLLVGVMEIAVVIFSQRTSQHSGFTGKEGHVSKNSTNDKSYLGSVKFDVPGRLFTYAPADRNRLSIAEIEEVIQHISHYRDDPQQWSRRF